MVCVPLQGNGHLVLSDEAAGPELMGFSSGVNVACGAERVRMGAQGRDWPAVWTSERRDQAPDAVECEALTGAMVGQGRTAVGCELAPVPKPRRSDLPPHRCSCRESWSSRQGREMALVQWRAGPDFGGRGLAVVLGGRVRRPARA